MIVSPNRNTLLGAIARSLPPMMPASIVGGRTPFNFTAKHVPHHFFPRGWFVLRVVVVLRLGMPTGIGRSRARTASVRRRGSPYQREPPRRRLIELEDLILDSS